MMLDRKQVFYGRINVWNGDRKKTLPVFMYIFLNKIEDTEEVRWTEKEKNEGIRHIKSC